MRLPLQRFAWLLPLLICGLVLGSGAALAANGDDTNAVSPNQVSIAGEVGGDYERTLLVRLGPGVEIEGVVPGDLNSADGTSVLPAESIMASWPTPEPEVEPEDEAEGTDGADTDAEASAASSETAEGAGPEPEADAALAPNDDPASDGDIDAENEPEADVVYPIPLTVAVNLFEVASGQYTGDIFIVTSEGELPVTLNVSVKARGIWPMLVLLAGLALGIGMSTYRKRGRQRDELLVQAGTLRESMEADPQLADDGSGPSSAHAWRRNCWMRTWPCVQRTGKRLGRSWLRRGRSMSTGARIGATGSDNSRRPPICARRSCPRTLPSTTT